MEEIRYAASEYYKGCSSTAEKQEVKRIFERLDENKDGKVSYEEFAAYYSSKLGMELTSENFANMDEDGDGYLDFQDVVVFYYMKRFRYICDHCQAFIKGMYYSCIDCFDRCDSTGRRLSYDLCLNCYRATEFIHQHPFFLDNYVLFNKRTKEAHQNNTPNQESKLVGAVIEGAASGIAEEITDQVVSNCCSIM